MSVSRSISRCVEALECISMHVQAKRWQSLPDAEGVFTKAFSRLRQDMVEQECDVHDQETMLKLDQQLRRIQRDIRKEMCGVDEKLHMLETEQKHALNTLQFLGAGL